MNCHLTELIDRRFRVYGCSDKSYSNGTIAAGSTIDYLQTKIPTSGKSYVVGLQAWFIGEPGSKAYLLSGGKKVYPYDDLVSDPNGTSAGTVLFPYNGLGSSIWLPFPIEIENGASVSITLEHPAGATAPGTVNHLRLIVWHTEKK